MLHPGCWMGGGGLQKKTVVAALENSWRDLYIPVCVEALAVRGSNDYMFNATLTTQRCARSSWGILLQEGTTVKCEQWTRQSINWEFQAHQSKKDVGRPRPKFFKRSNDDDGELKINNRKVSILLFALAANINFLGFHSSREYRHFAEGSDSLNHVLRESKLNQ
jgi:hypothetical protein